MNGIYGNFTPQVNWQHGWDDENEWRPYLRDSHPVQSSWEPGWDDWNECRPYLRHSHPVQSSHPARRTLLHRARQWMLEDRPTGRPSGSIR
ncbi:Hypothetical predicted protein [Olea europaea subsp. europaea]|uniref:Uncharacterized protein n=1 Tax=Olea europaea subsp. europaea TaxID=158383 RepID=A0A8S0VGV1_OLEEU|nr:Hypothetical predicted protein [Olea europaea subsp. europaea]